MGSNPSRTTNLNKMAYSDKYPMPIKALDYFDLDVDDEGYGCKVIYLDGTETFLYSPEDVEDLAAVHEQMIAQVEALKNGEPVKIVPQYTEREQEMLMVLMRLSEASANLDQQIKILDDAMLFQHQKGWQLGFEEGTKTPTLTSIRGRYDPFDPLRDIVMG